MHWNNHSGKLLGSIYENRMPALWPSIPTPKYIFKRRNAKLHQKIYSRIFIPNLFTVIPNWKQPEHPTREWINKLWYIHINLSIKQVITSNNVDESHRHYIEWKKQNTKEYIGQGSFRIHFSEVEEEAKLINGDGNSASSYLLEWEYYLGRSTEKILACRKCSLSSSRWS